jgi:hypothetical protein
MTAGSFCPMSWAAVLPNPTAHPGSFPPCLEGHAGRFPETPGSRAPVEQASAEAALNWKLVLQLSMFGLAMAIGSAFVLPPGIETPLWPVIFIVVAIVVARRAPARYFLHGFFVGLANWVWVAAAHVVFHEAYAAGHAKDIAAMLSMSMPSMPPWAVEIVRAFRARGIPIPGASGVVIGLLSWIASKIAAPKRTRSPQH